MILGASFFSSLMISMPPFLASNTFLPFYCSISSSISSTVSRCIDEFMPFFTSKLLLKSFWLSSIINTSFANMCFLYFGMTYSSSLAAFL